jgi:hypothetical protein
MERNVFIGFNIHHCITRVCRDTTRYRGYAHIRRSIHSCGHFEVVVVEIITGFQRRSVFLVIGIRVGIFRRRKMPRKALPTSYLNVFVPKKPLHHHQPHCADAGQTLQTRALAHPVHPNESTTIFF